MPVNLSLQDPHAASCQQVTGNVDQASANEVQLLENRLAVMRGTLHQLRNELASAEAREKRYRDDLTKRHAQVLDLSHRLLNVQLERDEAWERLELREREKQSIEARFRAVEADRASLEQRVLRLRNSLPGRFLLKVKAILGRS